MISILVFVFLALVVDRLSAGVALYLCVDLYRLGDVAQAVATALENGDVEQAAARLKDLTGKDTVETSGAGVAHAAVEAVLKQANSLVAAPRFLFLLFGPFWSVFYRASS